MSAYIIGLTGQSGAGKTTVSREFVRHGFFHIDCDRLTHRLLEPGTDCSEALRAHFPHLFDGYRLDRRKAAAQLFADRELLDSYNSVIFPFITAEIQRLISEAERNGHELILLDAPTLYEAGADRLCDGVVACIADESRRLERVILRDEIDEAAAKRRFGSQHSEDFFRERADFIIENNGSVYELVNAAAAAAREIKERQNGKKEKQ